MEKNWDHPNVELRKLDETQIAIWQQHQTGAFLEMPNCPSTPCLKLSCHAATGCWSPALVFGLNTCASTTPAPVSWHPDDISSSSSSLSLPPTLSKIARCLWCKPGLVLSLKQSPDLRYVVLQEMTPTHCLSMDFHSQNLTYFWCKSGLLHQNTRFTEWYSGASDLGQKMTPLACLSVALPPRSLVLRLYLLVKSGLMHQNTRCTRMPGAPE